MHERARLPLSVPYVHSHVSGSIPVVSDSYWEPCAEGHSDEIFMDIHKHWCCRRCGTIVATRTGEPVYTTFPED